MQQAYARNASPDDVARLIGRVYFGTSAIVALCTVPLLALLPFEMTPLQRGALIAGCLLHALLSAWAWRASRSEPERIGPLVTATAGIALVLVCAVATLTGVGMRSPALGFFPLLVCILSAIGGVRRGLGLAALAAIGLGVLAWLHATGVIPPTPRSTTVALLGFHLLVLFGGLAGGMLIARVLEHYLAAAAEREQRFATLLRIAADWYWEQDEHFRYTTIVDTHAPDRPASPNLGRTPWEAPNWRIDADELDAHRADLEAHRPFANLTMARIDEKGRIQHLQISGEPRFRDDGSFAGYWGVSRDVTRQREVQEAVAASEMRYRTLFARSPSPLLLHRRDRILDANEAAARLLGYAGPASMRGASVLDHAAAGDSLAAARARIAQSAQLRPGEALPAVEEELLAIDGRRLAVQTTGVCVETASGPAVLSILIDITARKATEEALRRSEAMLSHLFATSPDCLALTELATGRFALVNQGFCNIFGWQREQVIGRTSIELKTWNDDADRQRLVDAVLRHGSVQGQALVFRRRSGARLTMLVSAARLDFEGRQFIVIVARDVSASERARLESEAILNTVSLAVAFVRGQRIVRINERHAQMFGWTEQELRAETLAVLWPERSAFKAVRRAAVHRLRQRQAFDCETELCRRDGSRFWCRLQAQPVDPNNPIGGGTIWSAEDITERREFEHRLATARDAAEAASRAKSAFLANTSHEIRTPLNGLLGLARLAIEPDLAPARRQQYLHQIHDSAQSLATIISDILDLSKIEAGKITLEEVPIDLRRKVRAVHHAYRSLAEAKGLVLEMQLDDALPDAVRGDPVRVRQILTNYVANAIKFTDRGTVRIECRLNGGRVRLAVHDSGPGIDAETQRRLFLPFSQADESTTRRFGGTGLGLSICRELAQLMGGEVGVVSAPEHGSEFWAELPLAACSPGDPGDSAGTGGGDVLRGARILVAEDNPVNMLIVAAMLEQWGVQVTQCTDGAAAVAAASAGSAGAPPFDVVLMDVHMPVMSGHEAVRHIRERYDAQTLPVIALTAAALVSERDETLAAGMNDFLTKPIDARRLRATLARHLTRRSATAA